MNMKVPATKEAKDHYSRIVIPKPTPSKPTENAVVPAKTPGAH